MDVKYIDLDKYVNMLKVVRELQNEYEIKRHRSNRIALISYQIFSRLLFDKENMILAKRKEKFDLLLDKIESEIKETMKDIKRLCGMDNLKGLNDEESKIKVSWFVPYIHEWSVINSLRESSFDTEREDFERIIYYSTKDNLEGIIKDVKESIYQKIFENGRVEYYKKGILIPVVVDKKKENWKGLLEGVRGSHCVGLGIDFGMYDFVKYLDEYLKNILDESSSIKLAGIDNVSVQNYKKKYKDFDDIFTISDLFINSAGEKKVFELMEGLKVIGEDGKWTRRHYYFRVFVDFLFDKKLFKEIIDGRKIYPKNVYRCWTPELFGKEIDKFDKPECRIEDNFIKEMEAILSKNKK